MENSPKLLQLWLVVGLVAGFLALTFFAITYMNDTLLCDVDCRCKNQVTLLVVFTALTGLFVGSLTYYFVSEKHEDEMIRMHKDLKETFKFLPSDHRKIVEKLVQNKGRMLQSRMVEETDLSRVKVSRVLKTLEKKGIISKESKGMTNEVRLSENLRELF